MLVSIQSVCTR